MKKLILTAWVAITALTGFAQNPPIKVPENMQTKTPAKKQANTLDAVPIDKGEISIRERKTIQPVYNFSNTRICVDQKEISSSLPPKPVYVPPPVLPKINSNGDLIQPSTVQQGLTSDIARMWSPGDVITVGFATNETTQLVIDKVKLYAKQWETIANIKFQFVDLSQAKVRVGFAKDNTSWSWVGRDVVTNTFNQKTVNFGWFDNTTSETEFRRVILHEFGHVLGFVHEHQSPNANIPWDKEKVYALFALPPDSWDRAKVDANVFAKYSQNSTNSSTYDPSSIMHYFFSADLTTNGMSLPGNTNFSSIDKEFSKFVYPFPPANSNATGLLHTGDDCDEIVFTVEYDVVDKNVVEFILEPGRAPNGNLITWWKKIAVPVVGNGEVGLEMQDGNSSTKTVVTSILDKSRGISFGKAKVFGVHTGLGFKWNVLPALRGGCRVRLTWRRDGC